MTPDAVPPLVARVDRAEVRFVVTLYDNEGRPHRDVVTQPVTIYRAATPDVWAVADSSAPTIAAQLGATYGPAPTAPFRQP